MIVKKPESIENAKKHTVVIRPVSDWSKYYVPKESSKESHEEFWSRFCETHKK